MKKTCTFLIAVALVAGMVGCGEGIDNGDGNGNGNGNGPVSYQLTVASTSGGSVVEPGEGVHIYEGGTAVDLVAEPDTGYRFASWTGDVGTVTDVEAASTIITLEGDYSITASFEVLEYTLTIDSTEGGSVSIPGEGTFVYDAGTVVDLAAEADEGYRFVSWTGDLDTIADVETPETIVTMSGDYLITASFEEQEIVSLVGDPVSTSATGPFVVATTAYPGTEGAERRPDGGFGGYAHIQGAYWVWMGDFIGDLDHPLYFYKEFSIPEWATNVTGTMEITADNFFTFSVNDINYGGTEPPDTSQWANTYSYPITNLSTGRNHLLITVWEAHPGSPSGLVYRLTIEIEKRQ